MSGKLIFFCFLPRGLFFSLASASASSRLVSLEVDWSQAAQLLMLVLKRSDGDVFKQSSLYIDLRLSLTLELFVECSRLVVGVDRSLSNELCSKSESSESKSLSS